MIDFFYYLTTALFITVCVFMILLVLIQKGRGGGLASAFGGSGGNTAFGSKTGDVLTWATSIVFGIFLVLAVALNLIADARVTPTVAQQTRPARQPTQTMPVQSPTLPPPPTAPPGITEGRRVETAPRPIEAELAPADGGRAAPQPVDNPAPATQPAATQPANP